MIDEEIYVWVIAIGKRDKSLVYKKASKKNDNGSPVTGFDQERSNVDLTIALILRNQGREFVWMEFQAT